MLDRREMLAASAGSLAGWLLAGRASAGSAEDKPRCGMGLVIYTQSIRRRALQEKDAAYDLWEPLTFLEHAARFGAGGMQGHLGIRDNRQAAAIRKRADELEMYVEASIELPENQGDVERFDAEVRTAVECGALVARTYLTGGRRYETFFSLDELNAFHADGRRRLELAAPVVQKHRIPLALENHKDQRTVEILEHLQAVSSEFVGSCVDTGNSIALLEDPVETAAALAPWAYSVHLKDQAVQPYEDGFLLGDIPFGQGMVDLLQVVETIRRQKPNIRFSLELITRDPLKVPCLTESYWSTMPGVSGNQLAQMLKTVQTHTAPALQQISKLDEEGQVRQEESNVIECLRYAREQLGL